MGADERETIVRIDYANQTVHVWSTQRGWWSKCESLGMTPDPRSTSPAGRGFSASLKSQTAGVGLGVMLGSRLGKCGAGLRFSGHRTQTTADPE